MYQSVSQRATNALVKVVVGIVVFTIIFAYIIWSARDQGASDYREEQLTKSLESTQALVEFHKQNRAKYDEDTQPVQDPSILDLEPTEGEQCEAGCTLP